MTFRENLRVYSTPESPEYIHIHITDLFIAINTEIAGLRKKMEWAECEGTAVHTDIINTINEWEKELSTVKQK